MRFVIHVVGLFCLSMTYALGNPALALGNILVVDSTGNMALPDTLPGDGLCRNSSGDCTLRAALEEANAQPGSTVIQFAIPTDDPGYESGSLLQCDWHFWRIVPSLNLVLSGDDIHIDGGSSGTHGCGGKTIVIDGQLLTTQPGFTVNGSGNTIEGVTIDGGFNVGVTFGFFSAQNRLLDSWIGIDPVRGTSGSSDPLNDGIVVDGDNNVIGEPGAGNYIAGTQGFGIIVEGEGTLIQANVIGRLPVNVVSDGNLADGIFLSGTGSALATVIGGETPEHGNLIASNAGSGITLGLANNAGVHIRHNEIGEDKLFGAGNGASGILIDKLPGQTAVIVRIEDNSISNNNVDGISITHAETSRSAMILNNRIGVGGVLLNTDQGNGGAGIRVTGVNFDELRIGDMRAGLGGNVIAFNDGPAVTVPGGAETTGVSVSGLNAYSNNGLPVDLADDGPTVNDAGDDDEGANRLQNHPVLEDVFYDQPNGELDITYRVPTDPVNATYPIQVEFYLADSAGNPLTYLGRDDYLSADHPAAAETSVTVPPDFNGVISLVALATDDSGAGNSSEFSPRFAAVLIHADSFESKL